MQQRRPKPGLSADVSVPLIAQRTWQRKWRDVLHARNAIDEMYQGNRLDVDDFTRRIEIFFKTCHELGDWIEESIGLPAKSYAKTPPTLELCDAAAQTAKHHTRHQSGDPITAVVIELYAPSTGDIHADIAWTSDAGRNGKVDALVLADECISEWESYFGQNGLDPKS